jgi:hypothetical protein
MRGRPRQASRTNGERRPAYARRVGKGRLWGRGGSFGRAASALAGSPCATGASWSTHRKMGSSHLEPTAISGALRQVLHHGTSRIYSTRLSRSQYYATRTRPTGASASGPTGRNAIGVQPECPRWVIRVAPTGSKASPNVCYAFNSDRICASQRTDAMCHVWTAPSWQGESSRRVAGRCSHVFGLLVRFT